MMKNPAGWLALIVVAAASLLMIFVVLPRINQGTQPLGDAINAAGNAVKDAVKVGDQTATAPKPSEQAANPAAPATAVPATPTPAPTTATPAPATPQAAPQPAGQAAVKTPSFDVLRVEPDGSTVIAGRAEPHSTLEVTDGSSIVAKVNVGPSGDFAAVLDTPLPPGDHQLVLKATGKDGKAMMSEETATVSVPANKNSGKLLAMVTTPGKASRLIATPTPAAIPAPAATPQATPEAAKPAAPTQPATETAAVSPSSAPATPAAPPAIPALPDGSAALASTAPNVAATTPSAPAAAAPAIAPGAAPELQITAVEIEGAKIFVAGIARSGSTVRGLADGKPIGQTRSGGDGHFVIEGTADLTVGDHKISVESLNAAGQAQVRVDVPFNRPAGEQVAAVAAPAASPMPTIDDGAFDKLRSETARAFNILQGLFAGGKTPSLEQVAAGRSATSIALKSLTEYRLPAGAAAAARQVADATAKDASAAVVALDALPQDVGSVGAALTSIRDLIARALGPAMAQQIDGVAPDAVPVPTADAGGARTIQQAALTQSERSAVIIRRGDTLWQISRRVYGQGVRYTTIYLANEDQITNPDVIRPGQIFGVPDEARPDAEELHRQRLMHRKG